MIKKTGDLRKTLCDSIEKVIIGKMKVDVAATVVRLASQVNESFYSEIAVKKVQIAAKEAHSHLGALSVGE
jgi:hypothetical protein